MHVRNLPPLWVTGLKVILIALPAIGHFMRHDEEKL